MSQENVRKYAECLSTFCYFLGQMGKYAKLAKAGEVFSPLDEARIVFAAKCAAELKPLLLKRKEALGFTDALAFLEDNRFAGFEVENGIIQGDTKDLEKIINPWVCGFPDTDNHYTFEVSNCLLYFAEPDIINLYPERLRKESVPCKIRKIKRNYFPFNLLSSVQEALGRTS